MASIYYAKWVLLPSGEVLENGAVAVSGDSITAAGARSGIRRQPGDRIINAGDTLLMPGLINMHTHLEECVIRDEVKSYEETFASWTAKKNTRLKLADTLQIAHGIRLAIREMLANGITTIVDSCRTGISPELLLREPVRSWVIHEVHCEDDQQEAETLEETAMWLDRPQAPVSIGAGPYALYSLSPEGHRIINREINDHQCTWACHIAESAEELQAFTEHTNDLYFQVTRKRHWPFGPTPQGSLAYALDSGCIPEGGICFHCNYASGAEFERLALRRNPVVLCRQYDQLLGHKDFSLDVALKRGVNICLGTESFCEGGSLDLFDEMHSIKRAFPHIPAVEILRWATLNPARALGRQGSLGCLAPGAAADLIGMRFAHGAGEEVLEELLMEDAEVKLVVVNGEEIIFDC